MSIDKDISRLEKNRAASFELSGVVAARTVEEGKKTHDAIKHICEVPFFAPFHHTSRRVPPLLLLILTSR